MGVTASPEVGAAVKSNRWCWWNVRHGRQSLRADDPPAVIGHAFVGDPVERRLVVRKGAHGQIVASSTVGELGSLAAPWP